MDQRKVRILGVNHVAKCALCTISVCVVHIIERQGALDLGICKGCPCSMGTCTSCGETGRHWLGCDRVGIPETKFRRGIQ